MQDARDALVRLKDSIVNFERALHALASDEEFNNTADTYREEIIDLSYSMKRKLLTIDVQLVKLLDKLSS